MIVASLSVMVCQCVAQERLSLDLEEGKSGAVWNLVLGVDGKTLFSCGRDSTAKSWDLATGEAIRMFKAAQPTLITSLALDHTGNWLALGDMNGRLTLWNAHSGVQYYDLPAHQQYMTSLAITPDAATVITAGRDGSISSWKLDDGSARWSIDAAALWINAVAVSPDGAFLASAGQDGSVSLWRISDGKKEADLGRHSRFARTVLFSQDGKYLFSAGADGRILVWDMQTRAPFRDIELDGGYAHGLALDRGGDVLLVSKMNGLLELWDWKRRMIKKKLSGDSYGTMSAVFSANDERLYSAHTSGAIKVWTTEDGSLLLDMVGFSDGQWLSFTPDGYYDCSSYGDRYVRWRRGEELFPLERYSELYHRPSIIEDVLRGGYKPAGSLETVVDPPVAEMLSPRDGQLFAFGSEALEVVVEVVATDISSIENIALLLNDRQLTREQLIDWTVVEKSATQLHVRCRMHVLPGKNSIEAVAFNASRGRSAKVRADITVETSTRINPSLYVLAVGSDSYAPAYPDLQFASVDAEALADELARQEGGMYARVYTRAITGKNVTKEGIFSALKEFGEMKPEDVLVLFFSGHGVRERDKKGRTKYYYLPAGTTKKTVTSRGLAWEDFSAEIAHLNAGRIILLLDACHSGDVSSGASNEKVASSLAGQVGVVFTSSSGNEYSYEDRSWGHGAFTKALLDGIRGAADFTADKTIDWGELQLYVGTAVRTMTKGGQNPMVPRLEQFANFDFVRVR
ncbi:MAG: caspase family protein [Bacteroidetes bacterium]|nr:caspase family protein [Bacteroidota bacterium]